MHLASVLKHDSYQMCVVHARAVFRVCQCVWHVDTQHVGLPQHVLYFSWGCGGLLQFSTIVNAFLLLGEKGILLRKYIFTG
jgi:hypothetical protein